MENIACCFKSRLTSKKAELGAIPDGFLLDLSDPDNPILYVLEVELRSHGLEHIAIQILKFAISYRESKPRLKIYLKDIIREDPKLTKRIDERLTESNRFKYLDQLIDEATEVDTPTIVIPIDGLDESLRRYLPVERYVNIETG